LVTALCSLTGCAQQNSWLTGFWGSPRQSPLSLSSGELLAGKTAEATDEATDEAKGPLALARLSERRGQTEQAEQLYRKMIERFPDNPLPYHRLGVMRSKAGKWEEAETFFQQALALDPSNPDVLADLGYLCYLRSMPEQAEEYLRRALEIEPNHTKSCNNLAILLGEQGHLEECLALLRRAGSEAQAQSNLAFVLAQRGELDRAIEAYSRALTLDDSLRPAAEALVQLAKYAPSAGASPQEPGAASESQVNHLVYRIERKVDATGHEPGMVQQASGEVATTVLSDQSPPAEPPTGSMSGQARSGQSQAEPTQFVPGPSGNIPSAWKPSPLATPGPQAFNYCHPAGVQLPAHVPPAVLPPQPSVTSMTPAQLTSPPQAASSTRNIMSAP
jgi:Flp pilus assembly protein TadD